MDGIPKFLIEHPGDKSFTELSEKVRLMIEEDLGFETETIIGKNNGKLSVLTEEGADIFSTTVAPDLDSLKLYLSLAS